MIKCCNVNEYGSFNKVGTVLEKKIDQLNDDGYKILNVFETKVTKVPNCSDQAFIIIYDDGEKMESEVQTKKNKTISYEELTEIGSRLGDAMAYVSHLTTYKRDLEVREEAKKALDSLNIVYAMFVEYDQRR